MFEELTCSYELGGVAMKLYNMSSGHPRNISILFFAPLFVKFNCNPPYFRRRYILLTIFDNFVLKTQNLAILLNKFKNKM